MAKKEKLLVVTSRFPFPLEKGDKLRAYHQIKFLSQRFEIILCAVSDVKVEKEWIEELEKFCDSIHVFRLKKWVQIKNLIGNIFSNRPFQIAYFYQKSIQKAINQLVEKEQPDAVYCQLVRVTEYIKHYMHIPKTLDYMDALSEGMLKRSKIEKGLKKYLYKQEGLRLKDYENKIFDYFENHTIISLQDQQKIAHPKNKSIKIVPNGVGDNFLKYDANNIEKKFDLVFVGNLNYAPNIESCLFIIEKLVPYLKQKGLNVNVLLSGANPSPKILKAIKNDSIKLSGWVDDIRDSYASGKVFVAPLFIGTGLQNKLLEAMAIGLPCVTTSLAYKAIDNPDSSIFEANTLEEFYIHIEKLLQNPEFAYQVGHQSKSFVNNEYNWEKVSHRIPILQK
ncbi:MAG: glycosyltransferase [Putridiphycobacter sp.]